MSKNSTIEDIENYSYNDTNSKKDIPKYFHEINDRIFENHKPDTDLEVVKNISNWLFNNIKGGPGLSEPSDKALKIMLEGKGGVCSDRSQIFNNFCVINDIKVREWGVTRAPFNDDYGGHSFNEVFSKELNKWILLDVSYCIMFFHENDNPLSVIELYQLLRTENEVNYQSFNDSKGIREKNIKRNYLDIDTTPFLICNYSNKTYDAFLRRTRHYVPVFIVHFVLYFFGKSYYYKFPLDNYKKIFS